MTIFIHLSLVSNAHAFHHCYCMQLIPEAIFV